MRGVENDAADTVAGRIIPNPLQWAFVNLKWLVRPDGPLGATGPTFGVMDRVGRIIPNPPLRGFGNLKRFGRPDGALAPLLRARIPARPVEACSLPRDRPPACAGAFVVSPAREARDDAPYHKFRRGENS